ncbi:MAG: putative membrane protein YfcA [Parasphingorhabdus sp.]
MLFAGACLLAGFLRGFAGFGGPAVILLLLTHIFSPIQLVFKIVLIDALVNVHLLPSTIKQANWRTVAILTVSTLVSMPLGMYLLNHMDPVWVRKAVGVISAICTLWLISGYRYKSSLSVIKLIAIGLFSGVIFGATYLILVIVVVLLAGPDKASVTRANIILWAFMMALIYVPVYLYLGYSGEHEWLSILFLGCVYAVSAFFGAKLFKRIAERRYRQVALYFLVLLSLVAVVG